MTRERHSAPEQQGQSQRELVIQEMFDYTPLDADIVQQVQTAAHRIRQLMKQTVEDLIAVGKELLTVKAALPRGRFLPWLRVEFGWTDRTARRFMAVAHRFGTKMDIISDLRIQPTAAYLLAAPSVPEEISTPRSSAPRTASASRCRLPRRFSARSRDSRYDTRKRRLQNYRHRSCWES